MNTAVRAAIEARITELDARIEQGTEIANSYDSQLASLQASRDEHANNVENMKAERTELQAALPEEVEE